MKFLTCRATVTVSRDWANCLSLGEINSSQLVLSMVSIFIIMAIEWRLLYQKYVDLKRNCVKLDLQSTTQTNIKTFSGKSFRLRYTLLHHSA